MKGLPGVGKSTLARALSRELAWPLIDKDDVNARLHARGITANGPAYDVMLALVDRQLAQGLSVVCDSPLLRPTYENISALAASRRAPLAVIECYCSDETLWRERLQTRVGAQLPAHRIANWEALRSYRQRHPDAAYPITGYHLLVDTAQPLPSLTARTLDWLRRLDVES